MSHTNIVTITNTKHNARLFLHKVHLPQDLSKHHRVKVRALCPNPDHCCGKLHKHPLSALAISADWMLDRPIAIQFSRGRPFYVDKLTVDYGIDRVKISFDPATVWREITEWPVAAEAEYTEYLSPLDMIGEVKE